MRADLVLAHGHEDVEQDINNRVYEQTASRFAADGWIVGRKSMESSAGESQPFSGRTGTGPRATDCADRQARKIAVAIDPTISCT
ncbi:hypothetical protein QFZ94_004655 [Paraburkholderia sp. JPY465]|uniref:hypothetical protein n=1 Tax=Paraburkholderia sp. JPY465 TaxID=3042285 RepID=UPI003D1B48DC